MLALAISNGLYATVAVLNANAAAAIAARQLTNPGGSEVQAGRGENVDRREDNGEQQKTGRREGQDEDSGDLGGGSPSSRESLLREEDRVTPRPHSAASFPGDSREGQGGLPLRRRRSALERSSRRKRQEVAFGTNFGVVAGVCAGSWCGAALQFFVPRSW